MAVHCELPFCMGIFFEKFFWKDEKMKKYLSLAFLMAGVSLLAACGDDDSSSAEETKIW